MKLRCQICFEWISEVDKKALAYPMNGTMFKSVDTHHGIAPPFTPAQVWEDFRCPYGPHRPMIKDDEIQTDEGLIVVTVRGVLVATPTPPIEMSEQMDRKDFNTERTVKKRGPIKDGTGSKKESSKKGYACETCQKEFEKEINLSRHKRMAHKGV
jgi:hypothetical protein